MTTFRTNHRVTATFIPFIPHDHPMNTPCVIVHDNWKRDTYHPLSPNPAYHSKVALDVFMNDKDPVCNFFNDQRTTLEFTFDLEWEMTEKGAVWIREETHTDEIMMIFDGPGGAQMELEFDMRDYGGWAYTTWDANNKPTRHPMEEKNPLIAFLLRIAERIADDWKSETGPGHADLQALQEEMNVLD